MSGARGHWVMTSIGIIGSGIIGRSWALVFARAGFDVRLMIRRTDARGPVAAALSRAVIDSQALTPGMPADDILARITFVARPEEVVEAASLVIEAIPEELRAKEALFRELESYAPADAILASSTSSFGASRFAADLPRRSRVIVAHPLAPPHLLPATEIVPAPFTALETVERIFEFMRAVGQKPLLVRKEQPGFVMNRLQGALLIEMMRTIGDGIMDAEDLDSIITDGFGLRWAFLGPFAGIDLNAPGGIADYLKRYGFMFDDLARERGMSTPVVTPTVIDVLHHMLRSVHPLEDHSARVAARDRSISALRAFRHKEE